MKLVLEKIQYGKYEWNICGDLKVIAFYYLPYNLGSQNFVVFCASGTAEIRSLTTLRNHGLNVNLLSLVRKMYPMLL